MQPPEIKPRFEELEIIVHQVAKDVQQKNPESEENFAEWRIFVATFLLAKHARSIETIKKKLDHAGMILDRVNSEFATHGIDRHHFFKLRKFIDEAKIAIAQGPKPG